ncbi:hypothetical protein EH228_05970 [Erwinia endophytica]|uniref:LPS translocon maturation chaperone LptM n=1 Tax=Erwinia endophytica TaxID=1563158 RepID=UPI001265E08B|nr:lipoprotein [Erwinia endophytica]KAB8312693.1 hypothetical protein EH228_05970 [Erwinia endophytica]
MNKVICQMALALAVASLVGCGLKGPLYFPPPEQPKQQTPPVTKSATNKEPQSTTTVTGSSGEQSAQ